MTINVVPVFRVVPNGLVTEGNVTRLAVTILATPLVEEGDAQCNLEDWPKDIAKWFAEKDYRLSLYLQRIKVQGQTRPECDGTGDKIEARLRLLRVTHPSTKTPPQWQQINEKWKETFFCSLGKCDVGTCVETMASPWTVLKEALRHTAKNEGFSMGLEDSVPEHSPGDIQSNLNDNGSLKGGGSGQGTTETITTVLPVGHAAFAHYLEQTRGERVCAAILNPEVLQRKRDVSKADYQARLTLLKKASKIPDSANKETLLPVLAQRLSTAYKSTDSVRVRMNQRYCKITNDLQSSSCITPCAKPTAASVVPMTSDSPEMQEHVAIQHYGNWPESSDAKTIDPDVQQAMKDAISQAFFALQSSPSLARLFGLAFDAEIEIEDVRSLLAGRPAPVDDGYFYGFLGADQQLCSVSRAATAVCLEVVSGKVVGFLPATRAELALSAACDNTDRQSWLDSCDHHSGLVPMSGCLLPEACGVEGQRFVLTTLDVRRAVDQALHTDADTPDPAADKLRVPVDAGQRYATVGFCLNDRRRSIGVLEELAVMAYVKKDAAKDTLYAEDLVVGHVIDVQVLRNHPLPPSPWRCLMERHVRFEGLEGLDGIVRPLIGTATSPQRMDLERARITPITRVMSQPVSKDKKDLIVEESVAIWDGSPMGVDTGPNDNVLKQTHLTDKVDAMASAPKPPFVRHLDLPGRYHAGEERRPPPLRYGVSYRFAMRCVYAGGGGLTLSQAANQYKRASNAFVLPRTGGQVFRRNESILSPDVLMLVGDAIQERDVMGFESSLEVILRTANGTLGNAQGMFPKKDKDASYVDLDKRAFPHSTKRIIMPPPVGMEDAARHSMFDGQSGIENWTHGAMPLLDYHGGYPKCRDHVERGWNDEEVIVKRSDPTYATGQGVAAFHLRKTPAEFKADDRFYPDPAARYLVIGLLRKGSKTYVRQPGNTLLTCIPFYGSAPVQGLLEAKHYNSVMPVMITFEARLDLKSCKVVDQGVALLEADRLRVKARSVIIALAPFDEVEVHLWCVPDVVTLEKQFALPQYMKSIGANVAGQLWTHVSETGPIEELGAVQIIKAVHALNRPATDPVLVLDSKCASRIRRKGADGAERPNASAELVLKGKLQLPTASADSYELYLKCVSPHSSRFDDDQRGRTLSKRRAAQWPKYAEQKVDNDADEHCEKNTQEKDCMSARSIFGFDVSSSGKVTLPMSTVLLVRGDDVPPPEPWEGQPPALDVKSILREAVRQPAPLDADDLVDPAVGKVALSHQFADEKARRLFVRPVAIGRHAPFFNTRTTFGQDYDRQRVQRRISPLRAGDQSRVGTEQEVWLDAMMRPQPPELLACEPSFTFLQCSAREQAMVTMTRFADVRIRIKRPWFSSGEGEMLGIVLTRKGTADEGLVNDDTSAQAPFTRWGGDPIWVGGEGETELTEINQFDWGRCRHAYRVIEHYDFPVADTECEVGASACTSIKPVSLLLFEPHFDVDREEWYVDVPLRRRKSADPFVRFVLVRYQQHTAEGFEKTSPPVESWAKLLPLRDVEVICSYKERCKDKCKEQEKCDDEANAETKDWCVSVLVKGLSHRGPSMAPGLTGSDEAVPRMRMRLFHESVLGDAAPLSQAPLRRRPVLLPDDPDGHKFERGVPWHRVADGLDECKFVATITAQRRAKLGSGNFVVFLSEFERFMPATYTDDFAEPVTWDDIKNKDTLVESGARFSVRIEVPPLK
ncbi:hypothetical protein [Pseudomonas sp. Root562]|uniref:hypothetical protein n=1 Tax=Pseudomonas sp. Root562 TaxID=1736561 RepID=UPI000702A98C|nr:hypothetical protein [Pseudomonas sp. Root562]KQZ81534.1 hypothetical protein ASD60_10125 [Pseudomonas sp. Root562]